jgi:hypothetical protein
MRAFISTLLIASVVMFPTIRLVGQEKQGPDLKTAIEFMNRMVEPEHRLISMVNRCELEIVNNSPYNFLVPVGTKETKDDRGIPRAEFTWIAIGETYQAERISLGSIDPTSIKSTPVVSSEFIKKHHPVQPSDFKHADLALVRFETSDLTDSIELGGFKDSGRGDGTEIFNKTSSVSNFFVVFQSEERAERFVTALVRATTLCGGKPSDFPPTPNSPTPKP